MSSEKKTCFKCEQETEKGIELSLVDDWLIFKVFVCTGCSETISFTMFECSGKDVN